jgi:hypothetical protein
MMAPVQVLAASLQSLAVPLPHPSAVWMAAHLHP